MLPITVDDLIVETRNKLDEDNTSDISDTKILQALNRGARNCYQIIARVYDQIFLEEVSFTTTNTGLADIPKKSFGGLIEYVTYNSGSNSVKLQKVPPKDQHRFDTLSYSYPIAYTTIGGSIKLLPACAVSGIIGFMKKPATLVKSQGRITSFDSTTITVDSLGTSITTNIEDLTAFVSVIDKYTGQAKATFQVVTKSGNTVEVKATPDRTTVLGTTVTSDISEVDYDDYLVLIGGTCVLEYISDYSDYLVQYAVLEIRRSLMQEVNSDFAALKDLEKHIETIWSGRESDKRVEPKNSHWFRRRYSGR